MPDQCGDSPASGIKHLLQPLPHRITVCRIRRGRRVLFVYAANMQRSLGEQSELRFFPLAIPASGKTAPFAGIGSEQQIDVMFLSFLKHPMMFLSQSAGQNPAIDHHSQQRSGAGELLQSLSEGRRPEGLEERLGESACRPAATLCPSSRPRPVTGAPPLVRLRSLRVKEQQRRLGSSRPAARYSGRMLIDGEIYTPSEAVNKLASAVNVAATTNA